MYGRIDAGKLKLDPVERRARLGTLTDEPYPGEAECLRVLLDASDVAFCATRVAVSATCGAVSLDGVEVKSEALARVLSGCSDAYLLVVTLGFGIDRLTMKRTDTYGEFLSDAIADCLIEAAADEVCLRLGCKERLTNRFSPGYADLPLDFGRDLVGLTGADKLLGVRFTESGLMTPKKTVSAVVGIRSSSAVIGEKE